MTLLIWIIALLVSTSGAAEAAPVAGLVAAVSGWFTGTFGAVIGGFLMRTAASVALSALSMAIRGKPKVPQPGITTRTTTTGGVVPQRLIFGTYATGGQHVCPPMVYQTDGNPNEWLVYVVSLADKPITALNRIIVNGRALTIDGNPAAAEHTDAMGVTVLDSGDDSLRDKLYVRFHNGRQTAADAYLMRVFATYPERPWQADMVGVGVPYVVLTFKGKAQDGDYQGFPQVKFVVDGHALYDPRDATQNPANEATWKFTRNAAIIAYNILRGIDIPGGSRWGIGTQKFLLSYVLAAANLCDEDVPLYAGGTRKRYEASLEIGVDQEPHEALTEVLKAMGGDVADMGGTWLVRAGPPAGPVLSITDDDIIVTDSRSLRPYPGLAETVNAIHASYPDPDQQWEAKEAVPLYDEALEAKDGGRRLVADVNFPAVTNRHQVRALMREMLADHRRHRVHVITLPPDACGLRLGDHVAWSSVENGYNGKLFKVGQMRIDPVSLCVAVTLTERDPADYDYDAGSDGLVPTIPSPAPVAPPIVGVFGWDVQAVTVFGATGARPGIRIGWNPEIRADALVWTIKLAATGAVVARGDIRSLTEGFTVVTAGLLPSTNYLVSGRLVMRRRTLATEETAVTTHAVGISREELDVDLRDALADFEALVASTPGDLQDIRDDIDAAEQLIIDNLAIAKSYSDTGIETVTSAFQTADMQLAARIDEITAVSTSGTLIVNGNFADGLTGWTTAGTTHDNGAAVINAGLIEQTFAVSPAVGELFQWRVKTTGGAGTVRVTFFDADGAQIGDFSTGVPAASPAKVVSAQHTPPDETASARWRLATTGAVTVDDVAASTIDQQIAARLSTLEGAVASDTQALTLYKQEASSRFQSIEGVNNSQAQAIDARYTKSEANQAIASAIQEYNVTMTDRLGQKASSDSVSALTSRVTNTETGLQAQSDAITSLNSTVGRFSSGGLFRVQTVATPSDASSRIAIAAAASAGGATTTAGLYMDAVAGGKSRAVVVADLFAIASSTAPDAPKQYPFVVSGGNIWMDASVWIKDLTIGPNKVQIDGLSVLRDATFAETNTDVGQAWVTVGSLSLVAYEAGTKLDITGHIFLRAQIGGGNSISVSEARVLLNGVSLFVFDASGVTGINPGQYYETSIRQSVAVVGRSVAGTNTVQVQVRQRQNSITPKGAAAATIFVKEFRR